jgi:hypothetical protein
VRGQQGYGYESGADTNADAGVSADTGIDVQTCRVHPDWFGEASSEWVDENLQGRREGVMNDIVMEEVMMMMMMINEYDGTSFTSNSRMQ